MSLEGEATVIDLGPIRLCIHLMWGCQDSARGADMRLRERKSWQ